jgi:hypothetical protein
MQVTKFRRLRTAPARNAVIRHHKEVPFRLLEPDVALSHGGAETGNLIVQGDNLHALNNDSRGRWRAVSLSAQGFRPNQMYEIVSSLTGKSHYPPEGSCWEVIKSEYKRLLKDKRIYFGKDGNAIPSRIQFLATIEGIAPWTWWPHEEVEHTDESRKEARSIFGTQTAFDTPKPTRLI